MAGRDDRRRMPPLWSALIFVATLVLVLCPAELRARALVALCVAGVVTAASQLAFRAIAGQGEPVPDAVPRFPAPEPSPTAETVPEPVVGQPAPPEAEPAEEPMPEPEAEADEPAQEQEPEDDDDVAEPLEIIRSLLDAVADGPGPLSFEDFDPSLLVSSLSEAADVFGALRAFVGMVRTAEAEGAGKPCAAARVLARWLIEAGLFSKEVPLPSVSCIHLARTDLAYLHINAQRLTYLAKVRVLAIEAALNRMLLAERALVDLPSASEEDVYKADAKVMSEIATKLSREQLAGAGEWDARHGISYALETWPMPQRLTATFRTNLAGRCAAAVVQLPPTQTFPRSRWSDWHHRVVATSHEQRQRMASEYAARSCLMVAACALLSSKSIDHVLVAGVSDDGLHHTCHVSLELSRDQLPLVIDGERPKIPNPIWLLSRLDARMDPWNGELRPVEQGFSLDDERFCPRARYEEVGLSERLLDADDARALGTSRVRHLEIAEGAGRERAAADIMRGLSGSVEGDVRLILSSTAGSPDPTVREAALRTVDKLISGSLDTEPLGILDEFLEGDGLTGALRDAIRGITAQDPRAVADVLSRALGLADAMGTYEDTTEHVYRHFRTYAERALYNRLYAMPGREVRLVPEAYYTAHLMLCDALIALGDTDKALAIARRTVELDLLDERARMRMSLLLEERGDMQGAANQMGELLRSAHRQDVICMAYWRLAQIAWQANDYLAADACLRACMRFMGDDVLGSASLFAGVLSVSVGGLMADVAPERVDEVLRARDIPVAPTQEVSTALEECARAAVDAEVFPAARDIARTLGQLTHDDVIWGIARSIEGEPDR